MYDAFLRSHEIFRNHGVENPLLETLRLFDLLSHGAIRAIGLKCLEEQGVDLIRVVQARRVGVPLEYILGRATFMGLSLFCTPDTLIPRQETELLARVALKLIRDGQDDRHGQLTILDVGTGCGNLALTLALNNENAHILATDISQAAIDVARRNVEAFRVQERLTLLCGDLLAPLEGMGYEEGIDHIVCNPPYIPTGSLEDLAPEVIDYEPTVALDAGAYGIDIFRRLITESLIYLRPGGSLSFEIGAGQDRMVARLLQRNGAYEAIDQHRDGNEIVRVISARKANR